jgi:hypothetical protein
VIAANATLENDIDNAIISAAINNVMRFLIFSPPFPLSKKQTTDHPLLGGSRLRYWLCSSLTSAHLYESELLSLYLR